MKNLKDAFRNVDLKSAGIGAAALLVTEVAVYYGYKGIQKVTELVKASIDARNEGLEEIEENQTENE